MAEQQTILEDIANLSNIVTAARGLVEDGQIINIQPLENEVEDVCTRLTTVGAETARGAQPALISLIDELSQLAQAMEHLHGELGGELRSRATHGNAACAYSAPPAGPKKSP